MRMSDTNHAVFLAAALGAEVASHSNFDNFYMEFQKRYGQGWDAIMDEVAEIALELANIHFGNDIVWGETHDLYLTLEKIADHYLGYYRPSYGLTDTLKELRNLLVEA